MNVMPLELQPAASARFLSAFSQAQPPAPEEENQCEKPEPSRRNSSRRQRHTFLRSSSTDLDLDIVPSFAEFQQQVRVKSMYRQYLRLIYQKFLVVSSTNDDKSSSTAGRDEMIAQVRQEFKKQSNNNSSMSAWGVKRAMSEGSRRFKELSSMLGNSVVVNVETTTSASEDDDEDADNGSQLRRNGSAASSSSSSLDNSGKYLWPWQQQQEERSIDPTRRPWSPLYPSKSGVCQETAFREREIILCFNQALFATMETVGSTCLHYTK
jgi:hypothetical protein